MRRWAAGASEAIRAARRAWPLVFRGLHVVGWAGSLAAVATGVVVVWPPAHDRLIPLLLVLRALHSFIGAAVATAAGVGAALPLPRRRNLRDWVPAALLVGVLTATGVVLLWPRRFAVPVAASALSLHLFATWALVAWAVFHVLRKLRLWRPSEAPYLDDRRRFLARFLGWGATGVAFALLGPRLVAGLTAKGGGSPLGAWPIYSVAGFTPALSPGRYRLAVGGRVAGARTLSLDELQALPRALLVRDFHCVTGWVVSGVRWEGVAVTTLADLAGPLPGARAVVFRSADGVYVDSLTLAEAAATGALLADRLDGGPVPPEHGGPVRLVVPGMYGYKSVKWVDRVDFVDTPPVGTWEGMGYPSDAWIGSSP
jgi:DMSO/TMAO reductase YedYZ molybdopterin-dependent catalytic subunit